MAKKLDSEKRLGKSPDRADAYVNGLYALQFVEGQLIGGRDTYSDAFEDDDIYSGGYSAMVVYGRGQSEKGSGPPLDSGIIADYAIVSLSVN